MGKAHARKAGRRGFAGLLPNSMGVIPPLVNPTLRAAAAAYGHDPSGTGAGGGGGVVPLTLPPWNPPVRDVEVPYEVVGLVRDALARTANLQYDVDEDEAEVQARHRKGGRSSELPPVPREVR
eukprot:CAMPEP_0114170552 /NCGR_PEP_ID=MMETSP0043_2-20121206/34211_1 /TAXON_ID=464988 /ORGANISM="Hemiselmis andersenii, Strain CCMP644" /LENGTH=122 /DNA_ID=CAMNT_0001268185 /DNA_START=12 /DNA_END=377 /DNA_ORIENTATION=+